jgi:hypothetical protein
MALHPYDSAFAFLHSSYVDKNKLKNSKMYQSLQNTG